jgi:hypothetical protein
LASCPSECLWRPSGKVWSEKGEGEEDIFLGNPGLINFGLFGYKLTLFGPIGMDKSWK